MSLTSTSPTTVSQNPHHLRNAGCTANWATSRPRSTSRPTTLLHRTHHPGSPHTGRRHETRDGSGKLFLDSVLDMGSRRIAGFALGEHHDAELAYDALAMAVAVRGGRQAITGVIFHSDQ